jgi:hypothetical protein
MHIITSLTVEQVLLKPASGGHSPLEIQFEDHGIHNVSQSRILSNTGSVGDIGIDLERDHLIPRRVSLHVEMVQNPDSILSEATGCVRADRRGRIGPWDLVVRTFSRHTSIIHNRTFPYHKKRDQSSSVIVKKKFVVLETPVEATAALTFDFRRQHIILCVPVSQDEYEMICSSKPHYLFRLKKVLRKE